MHDSEISATAHLQTNNRPCIGLVWVCVWYCFFRCCFLLLHLYRSECCLNLRRMYVIQIYGKKNVRVKSIYSQTCGKNIGSNICGKFCYWILLSFRVDFFCCSFLVFVVNFSTFLSKYSRDGRMKWKMHRAYCYESGKKEITSHIRLNVGKYFTHSLLYRIKYITIFGTFYILSSIFFYLLSSSYITYESIRTFFKTKQFYAAAKTRENLFIRFFFQDKTNLRAFDVSFQPNEYAFDRFSIKITRFWRCNLFSHLCQVTAFISAFS